MKKLLLILSVLFAGSMSAQPTQINGNQIKDGAILNSKINENAAIHYSKINFTGIPASVLGLDENLIFLTPLSKTDSTVSLTTVPVTFGGTGLTSLESGVIPFGNGVDGFGSNMLFNWNDADTKLSIPYLKLSGNLPSIGYILSASDTDGNLTYTDPALVIPTNTIIEDNKLVVGTGTSVEAAAGLTYDTNVFDVNKTTVLTENADPYVQALAITGVLNTDIYDSTGGVAAVSIVGRIEGSSLVTSGDVNTMSVYTDINKAATVARGIQSTVYSRAPVTQTYPLFGSTFSFVDSDINRAFGVVGRVLGEGGNIDYAYPLYATRTIFSGGVGTIGKAAALTLSPPSVIPADPVYPTDETWVLIGTREIPAGKWTIYSTSTDPSKLDGSLQVVSLTSDTSIEATTSVTSATATVNGLATDRELTIDQGALTLTPVMPPAAPITTAVLAGTKPIGDWNYKVAWITATGETALSPVSVTITVDGTTAVTVSQPANPPALATGWEVYSSKLGPTASWWETTSGILPLTTLSYDDNSDDASLTVEVTNKPATAGRAIFLGADKVVGFDSDKTFIGADDITDVYAGQLGQAKITATGITLKTGVQPTCDATSAGTLWYVAGGTGVADTCNICRKDDTDAYAWVTIF